MGSVYGQHLYSENRYAWLTEWALKPCDPDVWYKTGYVPQDWALDVCNPGNWLGADCGPIPPNIDDPIVIPVPAAGTIAGEVRPVGSLSGKVGTTGTIAGVVRPVGNLQGKVLGPESFVGILPQFGPVHHASLSVSTVATPNDTETVATTDGTGTGLSLDRIPAGNVVWKFFVPTASIDARIGIIQEVTVIDVNLQYPPGFAYQGVSYKRDGSVYDGFLRPSGGPTWGSGAYLLMAYTSSTGRLWVGTTDLAGSNPVWFGDPLAGTGALAEFGFTLFPHVAVFGVGSDVFRFMMPKQSELPGQALGIHGVVHPVGSLHGTFVAPPVTGTITGAIQPVGALHGLVTVPAITGTITGVVRPAGSLQGTVSSGAPTTISARYWSINITAKTGAEAGVSELEFAQLGAAKYAGGTASATSTFSGFPASNVIDGNTSTAWVASSGALPQRLSVDFGLAVAVNVVRVKGRSATVFPTNFTVDYSSDGVSWTTAWTVTGADDSTYADTPLPYPNPTATGGLKPLWRINVTATESGILAVNEVEMRGSVGGTDLTGSGRPWCLSTGFGLPVSNAFDNNTATTYHASGGTAGVIGYEFTNSVSVLELYIYPRSGTPAQAPKNFTLQYSANGVSWTTAMSPAAQTGWTASVPRTFT